MYVLVGTKHKIGLIVSIDGSLWHKHIEDWLYYVLMPNGEILKLRGWRVEKVRSSIN